MSQESTNAQHYSLKFQTPSLLFSFKAILQLSWQAILIRRTGVECSTGTSQGVLALHPMMVMGARSQTPISYSLVPASSPG